MRGGLLSGFGSHLYLTWIPPRSQFQPNRIHYPDITLLWAANEGGTVAHANAVKTLGLGGKVFVFGTDMNNQMGQMLQAGDDILQGVTGQAPYQMGYDSFMTLLKVLAGEKVESTTNTPTIFFGRGDDALIDKFMETEGNAIFE